MDAARLGFDGVKFDAGGGNDDMNKWASELHAAGGFDLVENCNNGGYVPYKHAAGDHSTEDNNNCPFNMFRTGIDISPSPISIVSNLMDVSRYLNVSRPGCWAYPDM